MRGILLLHLIPSLALAQEPAAEQLEWKGSVSKEVETVWDELARVRQQDETHTQTIFAVNSELNSALSRVYEIFKLFVEKVDTINSEADAKAVTSTRAERVEPFRPGGGVTSR